MTKKRNTPKTSGKGKSGSPMDTVLLEQIVKLMAANDLNTVDVRDGDRRVIIKRGAVMGPVSMSATAAQPMYAAPFTAPATVLPEKTEEATYLAIKSPMVGTYYASSSPDAKEFVTVGTRVSDDTDVCIIEAMKVFNNIKAECRGTIAKILVTNGQTVEFGQTLFLVKP